MTACSNKADTITLQDDLDRLQKLGKRLADELQPRQMWGHQNHQQAKHHQLLIYYPCLFRFYPFNVIYWHLQFLKKIMLEIFLSKEKGCVLNINSLPLGIRWLHSNYFFHPGVYDLGGFDLLVDVCLRVSPVHRWTVSNTWTLLIDMASYGINSILAV